MPKREGRCGNSCRRSVVEEDPDTFGEMNCASIDPYGMQDVGPSSVWTENVEMSDVACQREETDVHTGGLLPLNVILQRHLQVVERLIELEGKNRALAQELMHLKQENHQLRHGPTNNAIGPLHGQGWVGKVENVRAS